MTKPINKTQIQLIHIAKAQLGISDNDYRILLMERYPNCFGTCKDLSYDEASDLINYFKSKGFKIVTKRYGRGTSPRAQKGQYAPTNIIQLASKQQLAKIEHLRADIRWHVHDGYFRWLRKWLKKEKIQTGKDAFRVIEGLKGMLSRQQSKYQSIKGSKPENSDTVTLGHSDTSLRRDGGLHGGYWKW